MLFAAFVGTLVLLVNLTEAGLRGWPSLRSVPTPTQSRLHRLRSRLGLLQRTAPKRKVVRTFMRQPSTMNYMGKPVRSVYVLGPESSGTRFVSRSISHAVQSGNGWDGEYPPCITLVNKTVADDFSYTNVHHVSLPWGGWCEGETKVVPTIDQCHHDAGFPRFFVDIESLLKHISKARAVIVTRDPAYTMRSVIQKHCRNVKWAKEEYELAMSLIGKVRSNQALSRRVFHLSYEELEMNGDEIWAQLLEFLELPQSPSPQFISGNHRRVLAELAAKGLPPPFPRSDSYSFDSNFTNTFL